MERWRWGIWGLGLGINRDLVDIVYSGNSHYIIIVIVDYIYKTISVGIYLIYIEKVSALTNVCNVDIDGQISHLSQLVSASRNFVFAGWLYLYPVPS